MRSHAALELQGRITKAKKIHLIVERYRELDGAAILEVGAGSGVISAYLSGIVGSKCRVDAVDVVDERIAKEGYTFQKVEGVYLTFDDEVFDGVISNHVIEHVDEIGEQRDYLKEMARVLKSDGLVYVAAPNKHALIEPHYLVPLLSWFPRSVATNILRVLGLGSRYDCNPPYHSVLCALFFDAGLEYDEVTYEALDIMRRLENMRGLRKLLLGAPAFVYSLLSFIIPTRIFILQKRSDECS